MTLDRGACPICELEFDEPVLFRAHLADEHDLHDDEGTESEFGTYAIPPVEASVPPPILVHDEVQQRRQQPPQMGRPVGLIALVICLLGVLAGVIIFTGGDDEPASEEAADPPITASTGDAASRGEAPSASTSTLAPAAQPGAASTGASGAPGPTTAPAQGTTLAPAPGPSPTSTPTTPAPTTSTTAPGAVFASPAASDARITSCARDRDLWQVTYTWRFSGGSLWKPLASYTSLGSGRYQHVIATPRRDDVAITTVFVTDPKGAQHSVPLRPALSTASC